jgi:glutathione S-transferase
MHCIAALTMCPVTLHAAGKLSGQPVERAQFLQWLNFAETILEHSSSKVITGGLFDNGPDSRSVAMATARAGMAGQVDMIERELADHGGEYLLKSGCVLLTIDTTIDNPLP